jgi:hypothetical protein
VVGGFGVSDWRLAVGGPGEMAEGVLETVLLTHGVDGVGFPDSELGVWDGHPSPETYGERPMRRIAGARTGRVNYSSGVVLLRRWSNSKHSRCSVGKRGFLRECR